MTTHPTTLGGLTIPADHDAQGWHDHAMQRAAIEGIPTPFGAATSALGADKTVRRSDVAEVQAILDRYRITPKAIQVLADAERAGITAGTIVQLRTPNPNRPGG